MAYYQEFKMSFIIGLIKGFIEDMVGYIVAVLLWGVCIIFSIAVGFALYHFFHLHWVWSAFIAYVLLAVLSAVMTHYGYMGFSLLFGFGLIAAKPFKIWSKEKNKTTDK